MPEPVIIIGAARSGTKFLRDLLAAGSSVAAVPYDVNYVWRYGAGDAPDDVLHPDDLTPARKRFIRRTLPSLAKAKPGDVLVEKTVSNTLRVPFVAAVFPNARFVHLIRDGRDVAESAMRQWETPPQMGALFQKLRGMPLANIGYVAWFGVNFLRGLLWGRKGGNVWGPRFPGIEDVASEQGLAAVCAQQWTHSVAAARRDLAALPPERVFEIRYDDLIADETALRRLVNGLELPDAEGILAAWRARVRPSPPAQWSELPDADRAAFEAIMGPQLQATGYSG